MLKELEDRTQPASHPRFSISKKQAKTLDPNSILEIWELLGALEVILH